MANKRDLKKQIRYVCGDLAAECGFACEFIEGINQEKINDTIVKIAALQTDALSKATFGFDKTRADFATKAEYRKALHKYNSAAFSKLRDEFNSRVEEIVKEMNSALPSHTAE
ncbi:MAG: hypothetical protein HDR77_05165 [Bacteroides sp.]|nr:hypothetical protein [Bacteroides sp.]